MDATEKIKKEIEILKRTESKVQRIPGAIYAYNRALLLIESDEHSCVIKDLESELIRAKEKHPNWPSDIIHAASILSEESGELTRAANQFYYEGGSMVDVIKEAVQTGAMAIRFLENLTEYERGSE